MVEELLARLKIRIRYIDDLSRYVNEDSLLEEAILFAISAINNRCGYRPKPKDLPYPSKYAENILRGAVDWLSRLGGSEYTSFSENGVSASYADVPSWLMEVPGYVKSL